MSSNWRSLRKRLRRYSGKSAAPTPWHKKLVLRGSRPPCVGECACHGFLTSFSELYLFRVKTQTLCFASSVNSGQICKFSGQPCTDPSILAEHFGATQAARTHSNPEACASKDAELAVSSERVSIFPTCQRAVATGPKASQVPSQHFSPTVTDSQGMVWRGSLLNIAMVNGQRVWKCDHPGHCCRWSPRCCTACLHLLNQCFCRQSMRADQL